jgi:hypothetical protein
MKRSLISELLDIKILRPIKIQTEKISTSKDIKPMNKSFGPIILIFLQRIYQDGFYGKNLL